MKSPFQHLILTLFLFGLTARSVASDFGYVTDIKAEKEQHYYEVFLFAESQPTANSLQSSIFNTELSSEFKAKYIDQFGSVDTDALIYRNTKYAEFNDTPGAQTYVDQASIEKRKSFAEYMVKRLTEWHVDHYMKEKPEMRPIYEVKEKISHIEVKVNQETKFNFQYSLAGNTLETTLINPYLDSKVITYMDPKAFGPAATQEVKLVLGKDLDKKNRLNLYATQYDGIVTAELIRNLKGNVNASFASSSWFKDQGISVRETRTSIGVSNSF